MAKALVEVRSALAYDGDAVSEKTGLACPDESLTVQADKEDADINTLVKRFHLTGELPQNLRVPVQAEFVSTIDYHSAMNLIREADEAFMEMPADVRARFDHDPGKFVAFASDKANLAECRKLGLAVPEVEVPEVPVEKAPAAPAPAVSPPA